MSEGEHLTTPKVEALAEKILYWMGEDVNFCEGCAFRTVMVMLLVLKGLLEKENPESKETIKEVILLLANENDATKLPTMH